MSEENERKEECLCKKKEFKDFLVVAFGSFVGVFCALSLFCALHKPPMMQMPFNPPMPLQQMPMMAPQMMGNGFSMHNCPCHKKMMKEMKREMMDDMEKFKKEAQKHLENDD